MESANFPDNGRRSLLRSCCLPILLSLTIHGILVLALYALPLAYNAEEPDTSIETRVFVDPRFMLSLNSDRTRRGDNEAPPLFAVTVGPGEAIDPPVRSVPSEPGPRLAGISDGPPVVASPRGAGNGGQAGSGTWKGPSIFQAQGSGRSVVYVIDRSLSMQLNGSLVSAKRELLASLNQLPESVRFQLILYNREALPLRIDGAYDLVSATAENKEHVSTFVTGVRPEGGTDHFSALQRALALQPEVIFFITDAGELTRAQLDALTRQNHGQTAIHAIELSRADRGEECPLRRLAIDNRGTYRSGVTEQAVRDRATIPRGVASTRYPNPPPQGGRE